MKWHSLIIAAFCAVLLLTNSLVGQGIQWDEEILVREREQREERFRHSGREIGPAFRVVGLEDRPRMEKTLLILATQARLSVIERADMDWEGTALLVWSSEQEFMEHTGFRPEHIFAAASPQRMTIWINEAAWSRSSPGDRQKTLAHEIGHLLLGSFPGGQELPLWANEGIVMHLADQWTFDDHAKLLWAHLFGRLPPLSELEETFPRESAAQSLAYRMSYAAVATVANAQGDEPGSVRRLMMRLSHPTRGVAFAEELRDPFVREGWQIATSRSLGSRFSTGVALLTGSTVLFIFAAILVLIGFWVKKSRAANRFQDEEDEEAWSESLTQQDVEDIYGEPEERWKSED
ncbi:MAG: hypothetical protein JJU11_16705 [Candidatus Sumerlaeia bacterium]|nr:hypothetical protein [Candidatus Sumerlaeia bacterium]